MTQPERTISLVDDQGRIYDVPEGLAHDYVSQGRLVPATQDEVRLYDKRKELAGGTAALEAGARGIAETATIGLSEKVLHEFGADPERTRLLQEEQSAAHAVGEVLGMFAPGGLGKLAVRGAGAAGKGAQMALASRAVRPGFTRAAELAARGAVEGGYYGASQAVAESAIDDDFTAEEALSMVGTNALFGLGAELGTAALLKGGAIVGRRAAGGARKVAARARKKFGPLADGDVAGAAKEAALSGWFRAAGVATGKGEDAIRTLWNTRRLAGGEGDEILKAARKKTDEAVQSYLKSSKRMVKRQTSAPTADTVRSAVPDADSAVRASRRAVDEFAADIEELKSLGADDLVRDVERIRKRLNKADAGSAFVQVDDLRNTAFKYVNRAGNKIAHPRTGPATADKLHSAGAIAQRIADRSQRLLGDSEVWGTAALAHTEKQGAGRAMLELQTELEERFTAGGFKKQVLGDSSIDSKKLDAYLKNLGDPSLGMEHELTIQRLAQTEDELSRLAQRAGSETSADVMEALNATRALREQIGAAKETMAARRAWEDVRGAQWSEYAPMVAGYLSGTPAVGAAVSAVGRPAEMIQTFAAAESLWKKALKRDSSLLNKTRRALKTSKPKERLSDALKRVREIKTPRSSAALAVFGSTREEQSRTFRETVQGIRMVARDPRSAVDYLGPNLAQLAAESPRQAATVVERTIRTARYLNDTILSPQQVSIFAPQLGHIPPSYSEMQRLGHVLRVLETPEAIIDDIESGHVSRDAVQALQQLRPSTYQRMQEHFVNELGDVTEPPPYQRLLAMSVAFGIPGHPTLQPDSILRLQGLLAAQGQQEQQQPPPPPSRQPSFSQDRLTAAQRLQRGMEG